MISWLKPKKINRERRAIRAHDYYLACYVESEIRTPDR
jgi:hypothetical protein